MISRDRRAARGSWGWTLNVAEFIAWVSLALVLVIIHADPIPSSVYPMSLGVAGGCLLWLMIVFRLLLPRARDEQWAGTLSFAGSLGFALAFYAVLRGHVPSAQLLIVPVVVIAGLLSTVREGIGASAAGIAGYWIVSLTTGAPPAIGAALSNTALFLLTGVLSGLLAQEMRLHYRGELEEHRLATAVRHRLLAVLDAVDEAVVFRDRTGTTKIVNRQAGRLFEIDPDDYLGLAGNELLRTIARQTEDPEGFMEAFQELRDDPERPLRVEVDQIIPERRQLRLYSGPALDEHGALVGRIDVYTDVTPAVRRAAEVERLYEEARKTAESYQRSLLPDAMPHLPRMSFVARYVPAAGRRAVCGDFYDFVPLSSGTLGVTLGDVCGIGPSAANSAALARYTLRTFLGQEDDPGRVFATMNSHIYGQISNDRFIRLLYGVLDPERAVFEYVNAGHVPPVVYRARTGEVEWLGEGGIAMGVEPDADYKVGRIELEPADMLVLYTDGVTEAPRGGRPFGQGKFSDLVHLYGMGTPGELVQAIRRAVDSWVGEGELRDDLALLVCQVVPDAAISEPEREVVLPNEPARLAEVRAFVSTFLADVRTPVETMQDMLLAVGEAAGNATRHGRRREGRSEIRIGCRIDAGEVTVVVADDGEGFDPSPLEQEALPDRFASGGRGLFLMRQLVDHVEIESSGQGTKVVLRTQVQEAKERLKEAAAAH